MAGPYRVTDASTGGRIDDIDRFLQRHRLPASLRPDVERLLHGHGTTMVPEPTETIDLTPTGEVALPDPGALVLSERYTDLGTIGSGGMAEVRRVRDTQLGRTLAMKIASPGTARSASAHARFVDEAQTTAQLDHPGVVPVHELGRTADGRPFFTMKEVRGRTLTEVIDAVHAASTDGAWSETADGWTLHRVIDAFRRVCETVAHAHARGVVHRDLKPDNIMVGAFGEVLVVDWGLARTGADPISSGDLEPVQTARTGDESLRTRSGVLAGTPMYMSPEQARGQLDRLDPRSDVFSLGVVLYEILHGRPPYPGSSVDEILGWVVRYRLAEPETRQPIPEELRSLWVACTELDPDQRPADASHIALRIRRWQEGAERRERALAIVAEARGVLPDVRHLRSRAAEYRAQAEALLRQVEPWDPIDRKGPAWELQDEASRLATRADLEELRATELLRAALTQAPDLPEARTQLATLYRERHAEAEAAGDVAAAARNEVLLRTHDDGRHAAYLEGDGTLTLRTDPPGADVEALRFVARDRRLVAEPFRFLGRTPLERTTLPMGSYLLVLRREGHADVRYPVQIRRNAHWDGVGPGEREPTTIQLPAEGTLGPGDLWVPPGWFTFGGDPEAMAPVPVQRLWVDAFVVRRYPVTNAEFIVFLDDLVAAGREDDALRYAPRERGAGGELGPPVYGRDDGGRFVLRSDADGDRWEPDWPVLLVDHEGASAYAAWEAARTGQPWRLPWEDEWEKAARGVDGRIHPWGRFVDPIWACMRQSRPGRSLPAAVTAFPVDESVYGVRGCGGNAVDWCLDAFLPAGPPVAEGRALRPTAEPSAPRVARGGAWSYVAHGARICNRPSRAPDARSETYTLRLFRDG